MSTTPEKLLAVAEPAEEKKSETDLSSTSRIYRDLQDIIDTSRNTKDTVFNRYKPKDSIAEEIAKNFFSSKYNDPSKNSKYEEGFANSLADRGQVGLLTQAYGLQIIAGLRSLGCNLEERSPKINYVLNQLFELLGIDGDVLSAIRDMDYDDFDPYLLNFNISPFYADSEETSTERNGASRNCVESASAVLKALSEIRTAIGVQLDAGNELDLTFANDSISSDEMIENIEYIIKYTLKWLTDACIPAPKPNGETIKYTVRGNGVDTPDINYVGWNFFRSPEDANKMSDNIVTNEYEPSLFVTFSVCSAYISLKGELAFVQPYVDKNTSPDDKDMTPRYDRNVRLYTAIAPLLEKFQNQCMQAGRYEELRSNGFFTGEDPIDLSVCFIGQNYNPVTFEDITNSTTNDAMINTILHILILLYAGLDIDYRAVAARTNNPAIIDDFYDEMQYAIQNILRCYKKLNAADKSYIVDQYVLSFKEKMPSDFASLAKTLRRQRIQVASTLPLLIIANNEISKYLVQYPQKQNMEYLAMIMRNRNLDKNSNVEWAWDRDGYNITSQNYYIRALNDFYNYYDQYEANYIKYDEKAARATEKNKEMVARLTEKHTNEVAALKAEIDEKEKAIKEGHPIIKELRAWVDSAVKASFDKTFNDSFVNLLRTLSDASKNCGVKKDSPEGLKLFASLVYSLLSKGNSFYDSKNSDYFFLLPDAIYEAVWDKNKVDDVVNAKGNGGA